MDLPFDQTVRRRIHLMRHAEAAYWNEKGERTNDPRTVPLTAKGRAEAESMALLLAPLTFDRAICSGLPRTEATAKAVIADRSTPLEIIPAFEEIRSGSLEARQSLAPADYAYAMFRAHEPGAAFAAGESFSAFRDRILTAFAGVIEDPSWRNLLLVAHGGVNRAILGWALDLGLEAFGAFEQDSCCLNVIDIDVDRASGKIVRRIIRAVNVTAYDPIKDTLRLLTLEGMAKRAAGL
ncbi:MAG: histidine phosphatase family protein [Alphaproteobacteria bacterium]|nr:histidine phosphatase family protein [Alphaproteobacteria bacterium]